MKDISLTAIGSKLGVFFHRYGVFVFFLVIASGLITALILLNVVISKTDDADGYVSNVNNISFDKQTIKKIEALRTSDQETKKIDSSGTRLLPF